MAAQVQSAKSWRPLRLSVVITLILLSVQAWTGDFVNVFVTTSQTPVQQSVSGFFGAVSDAGPFLEWHAMEGVLILMSAAVVLAISLRRDRRSVKVGALIGLITVEFAAFGGNLLVLSGFGDGGKSKQMGGSFIREYAF